MVPGYPLDKNMKNLCRKKLSFSVPNGIVAPKIRQNQVAVPQKFVSPTE